VFILFFQGFWFPNTDNLNMKGIIFLTGAADKPPKDGVFPD
jgi:hypothetical protein